MPAFEYLEVVLAHGNGLANDLQDLASRVKAGERTENLRGLVQELRGEALELSRLLGILESDLAI